MGERRGRGKILWGEGREAFLLWGSDCVRRRLRWECGKARPVQPVCV